MSFTEGLQRFLDTTAITVDRLLTLSTKLAAAPTPRAHHDAAMGLRNDAELLQALITEFRTLADLQSAALPELHPLPLQPQVQALTLLFQELADLQDIELQVQVPADLIVMSHARLCTPMLRRLLDNAIRYHRPGGAVLISARARPHGGVTLRLCDNGHGLGRPRQQRPFLPFEREGKELCPTDGLGMGLAVAHTLASRQGIRLTVRARPGRGTIVSLNWPPQPRSG